MASSSPSSLPLEDSHAMGYPIDNHDRYIHGRVDPGIDENIILVESVEARGPQKGTSKIGGNLYSLKENRESTTAAIKPYLPHDEPTVTKSDECPLLSLPSEIIDHILSFLGPIDLSNTGSTCRLLSTHGKSDLVWFRRVQENIPGVPIISPFPCNSYRELYIAHDPHWFLPKYKIWFCDYFLTGKIVLVRYDPRRGCIEGYRLVAERPPPTFVPWEADEGVIIHSFKPKCRLHLDQPVIQLDAVPVESMIAPSGDSRRRPSQSTHRFNAEAPMRIKEQNPGVFSNFLLARPMVGYPNMQVWPPPTIPARHRVRNVSHDSFVGSGHKPQKRSDVSTRAFRIRRWMEMTGTRNGIGVHLGEEVYTYATLDPEVYTPTEDKPYRGIWVGDYSGHGCEFLLMNQPDDEEPFDETSVVRKMGETVEELEARKTEERIYRGSLEAIKLTGDPNIPRGEYTFIADDLSKAGFVRTATEKPFQGARIVKSRGHIAASMFRNDKYIESQLIMISHNRLAQYWVGFGHISFYERVDIDRFLSPLSKPPCNAVV